MEQNAYQNCFCIDVEDIKQWREISRFRRREYSFDILFFPEADNKNEFYNWQSVMLEEFETIPVGAKKYHTRNISISNVDSIWHFTFSVSFLVSEILEAELMENLIQKGVIKDGGK